jgi:sigma-E factor negative regulatory protein RseA
MKSRISALVDGELERHEAAAPLDALRADAAARDAWRDYHLIGDAMRDTRMLSAGFGARVAAKLAEEPTVMAPARLAVRPERPRWRLLSAAASIAAMALVGWVAFAPQDGAVPGSQVAQGARPAAAAKDVVPAAQVLPPDSANDYLYAHQGYSPRNSLQGMAPYVRMVSSESGAGKR